MSTCTFLHFQTQTQPQSFPKFILPADLQAVIISQAEGEKGRLIRGPTPECDFNIHTRHRTKHIMSLPLIFSDDKNSEG